MATSVPTVTMPELRPTVVDSRVGFRFSDLRELHLYRELLLALALRDIQVRYKQTAIGAGWAVLQPLVSMIVLTLIFSRVAHISSGGIPYPVLTFAGILPWQLFSGSLGKSAQSLVANGGLISKTYFPRIIVPLAVLGAPLFDFVLALVMLGILMGAYGVAPHPGALLLPAFALLALLASAAGGFWLSALHARFRDVGQVIPYFLQVAMYLTPVAYPLSAIPDRWRTLYSLNPLVGVIQGFRWGLLGDSAPALWPLAANVLVVLVLLVTGVRYFSRAEATVVDVM